MHLQQMNGFLIKLYTVGKIEKPILLIIASKVQTGGIITINRKKESMQCLKRDIHTLTIKDADLDAVDSGITLKRDNGLIYRQIRD